MGDLSPHFSHREFACHHCGRAVIANGLVARLEILRSIVGHPLPILSGYRCAVHNRAVGGARNSQHLRGAAVDFKQGLVSVAAARKAGFRGIGICNGWAVHVDIRPGPAVEFKDC
jgi:uncharacterized protein YcbK (DUF882 family)